MSGLFQDDPPPADDPPPPSGPGLFGAALPEAAPPAAPYRVLARKYRPTSFNDMIGQEAMVRTLRNAFAAGRVAHAFMLTGVRGVGKTTTARIIARALNCTGPDGGGGPTVDPCGVCPNCTAILADRHPDVTELDAASNNGIDEVRAIIEAVRFRPMQARTRVFILDEVHMLSKPAFNALLKTLEEPPPHVKFVFATTEIRKVPVTVLSRCQRFDLRRISVAELSAHFAAIAGREGVAVTPEALTLIARAADGSARDGLSLLDQAIAQAEPGVAIGAGMVADMLGLADRVMVFDLFEALMAGRTAEALAVTDRAQAHGADPGVLLADLLDLVHTLSRLKSVPSLREVGRPAGSRAHPRRRAGGAPVDAHAGPGLADAAERHRRGGGGAGPARRGRDGADPAVPRRRAAAAGRAGAPADRAGAGGGRTRRAALRRRRRARGGEWRHPGGALPAALAAPPPRLAGFRDVVALVAERRDPILHGHLVHSVHLVRFAPPVIELRPQPEAPRDLAARLAALLTEATGTRWTIALSAAAGEPTLAEQGNAADAARRAAAAGDPLVRAILETFPGARIEAVHDARADAYGLTAAPAPGGQAACDGPDFAPPDAEFIDAGFADAGFADGPPDDWEN